MGARLLCPCVRPPVLAGVSRSGGPGAAVPPRVAPARGVGRPWGDAAVGLGARVLSAFWAAPRCPRGVGPGVRPCRAAALVACGAPCPPPARHRAGGRAWCCAPWGSGALGAPGRAPHLADSMRVPGTGQVRRRGHLLESPLWCQVGAGHRCGPSPLQATFPGGSGRSQCSRSTLGLVSATCCHELGLTERLALSGSVCPHASPCPAWGPVWLSAAGAARGCPGGGSAAGAWREVLGALTPQGLTLATAVRLRPCWNGKLLAAWYKYIWPVPKIPGGSVLPPPAVLPAARCSAALSASSVPLTPHGSCRHRCPTAPCTSHAGSVPVLWACRCSLPFLCLLWFRFP